MRSAWVTVGSRAKDYTGCCRFFPLPTRAAVICDITAGASLSSLGFRRSIFSEESRYFNQLVRTARSEGALHE